MNDYQAGAVSTAHFPRVYTEDQVKNMLVRAYVRGSVGDEEIDVEEATLYANADLDFNETVFSRLVYPVLGLVGEAAEVAEKLKKVARDQAGVPTPEQEENLAKEVGDVLWYAAAFTDGLGIDLNSVGQGNLDKLADRKARNVIHGDGDDR